MSGITPSEYRHIVEEAVKYNRRLKFERRTRIPFIDVQTGVAQKPSGFSYKKMHRLPGKTPNQVYSYPPKRWKRPKLTKSLQSMLDMKYEKPRDDSYIGPTTRSNDGTAPTPLTSQMIASSSIAATQSRVSYYGYDDDEDMYDLVDAVEDAPEPDDDDSDYEDTIRSARSKRKKPGRRRKHPVAAATQIHPPVTSGVPSSTGPAHIAGGGGGHSIGTTSSAPASQPSLLSASASSQQLAAGAVSDDSDRIYACHVCSNRYKTHSGLKYHYSHVHDEFTTGGSTSGGGGGAASDIETNSTSASSLHQSTPDHDPTIDDEHSKSSLSGTRMGAVRKRGSGGEGGVGGGRGGADAAPQPPYCDFCLGNTAFNKLTGVPEEMVSCADCGRSGHPSCLKFTSTMLISVKKYPWQCIECKSCWLCGTQENDDQLLFCDDCDRGYHLYCLTPPLSEPPEGNWSCGLCTQEYHRGGGGGKGRGRGGTSSTSAVPPATSTTAHRNLPPASSTTAAAPRNRFPPAAAALSDPPTIITTGVPSPAAPAQPLLVRPPSANFNQ